MRLSPIVLAGLAAVAAWPAGASGATFTAACSGSTGDVDSLKNAINQANAGSGDDTIALGQNCFYRLTVEDNFWYGPNGLPPVSSDITIEGNGATIGRQGLTIQNPPPKFRLFFVGADPASPATLGYATPGPGRLTLRDVTLQGGLARGGDARGGGGGAGLGGAIFSQGSVVIERSTLTANAATGGSSEQGVFGTGGGGGIGEDAISAIGGGMGQPPLGGFGGGSGGGATANGGGGGGGFTAADDGAASNGAVAGAGGGASTGLAGFGGFVGAAGGNGGGGGGDGACGSGFGSADGSPFGEGGDRGNSCTTTPRNGTGGGGGGVGGGGGAGSGKPVASEPDAVTGGGGGGGFGGGGGIGFGPGTAGDNAGGDGGFGGGSGQGSGATGDPGFGGGIGNSFSGGGGAGLGGAIFNMQGSVTIRNSTLAGNSANGGQALGGASSNGQGIGGAVFNLSGSVTVVGSTIAANNATSDGASIYNLVYDSVTARAASVVLSDSILINDSAAVDLASDKPGATLSGTNLGSAGADIGQFNLVRTSVARGGGTVAGSALTADPLLGPLAPNGGATRTMAPAEGSPVIDAGSAFGLTTDQRGLTRPSDFAAIPNLGDGSDIGAVELQRPPDVPGPGGGPGSDTSAPVFASASLSNATFAVDPRGAAEIPVNAQARRGTTFRYTLSEDARVVFTIQRATVGRRVGRRCRRQTRSNRNRRRCTRFVRAGRFARQSTTGSNRHRFSGRIGRRSLRPGRHRVTLVATDAAGNRSAPRRLKFRIVKRSR